VPLVEQFGSTAQDHDEVLKKKLLEHERHMLEFVQFEQPNEQLMHVLFADK
jgi:hypothetical protein